MIHLGKKIKTVLETKGMSVSEFARRINTNRNNVYNIFQRESMDTSLLKKISAVLDHDFFEYYTENQTLSVANEKEEHYGDITDINELQQKIKRLEEENVLLRKWINDKDTIITMLQHKQEQKD